jgi:polyisoprenyl-phosphate glycosyltransferase
VPGLRLNDPRGENRSKLAFLNRGLLPDRSFFYIDFLGCGRRQALQSALDSQEDGMPPNDSARSRISFVIPVYNEEEVLHLLFDRLDSVLGQIPHACEVVFVNDGSADKSLEMLMRKAADPRFRVIDLSRNFGHQIAITAGIDAAVGDAIIIIDADLQDPPELAIEMIKAWQNGFDVVSARRRHRSGETWFKRQTAKVFYRVLARMSPVPIPTDVGDFRLISRRVADALRAMPEKDRYIRGMISWIGFKQTFVEYERDERAAGHSKYSLAAMVRLASNGILGFSDLPLRAALWFGLIVSGLALAAAIFVIVGTLTGGAVVPGWASVMILGAFLGGVQLFTLGVVGLYIGRIYNETKGRPLYFATPSAPVRQVGELPDSTKEEALEHRTGR